MLRLVRHLLRLGHLAGDWDVYPDWPSPPQVANFTAEFIRRKFADVKASGSGTSRKAKKKAAAAVAVAMTVGLIPPSMQCLAGFASASAAPVQKPSTPSAAQVVASAVARAPKQALQAAARQPPTAQAPAMLPPSKLQFLHDFLHAFPLKRHGRHNKRGSELESKSKCG